MLKSLAVMAIAGACVLVGTVIVRSAGAAPPPLVGSAVLLLLPGIVVVSLAWSRWTRKPPAAGTK